MFIYSMNMRENAPEETIIVFKILDIKNSFTVEGLVCFNVSPRPDSRLERAQTYG